MEEAELRATAVALRRAVSKLGLRLRAQRPGHEPGRLGLALLGHLYRQGPMAAGDLAAAERLQPQSVTRALAGLDDRGLITRTRDSGDQRRQRIELTEEGAAFLADYARDSDDWLTAAMAAALTPAECRLLGLAADLLGQMLDQAPVREP